MVLPIGVVLPRQGLAIIADDPNVPEDVRQRANEILGKYNDKLQYQFDERPRLLEEGLPIPPDYAFWAAILYMMTKHPAMLERLAKSFFENQAKIISHLAQAGAGNIITAYSHSFLISLMLEQNYMIRQRGADDLIASLNVLTGSQQLANLLQGFAVPEVLTYAATGVPIKGGQISTALKK